jgi:hypothetical protein
MIPTLACKKHKTLGCSPKEAWYSSFIVNHPSINFLAFDALAQKHYLAMTSHGTYAISGGLQDPKKVAIMAERMLSDKQSDGQTGNLPPTFSDLGQVRPITLIQGNYSGTLWYHPQHSTHYVPVYGDGDKSFSNDHYITYIHRLNGRTEERLEPVSKVEKRPDVIEEWLYVHFQEEKKKSKWVMKTCDPWAPQAERDMALLYPVWFQTIPALSLLGPENRMLLTEGHEAGGFWRIAVDDDVYSILAEK